MANTDQDPPRPRVPIRHQPQWADLGQAMVPTRGSAVPALPGLTEDGVVDEPTAWNWSLVLKSRRVPHRTDRQQNGWRLFVPVQRLEEAAREIRHYTHENPPVSGDLADPAVSGPYSQGSATTTMAAMSLWALFYMISVEPLPGAGIFPEDWLHLGNADSTAILAGQWWRSITALTIHADPAHFVGNAVIGGLFLAVLGRELGPGAAWLLFLLSGTLGNGLNAYAHGPGHLSLGASTAVFGAVGALGALRMARDKRVDYRRTAAPVVAGMALLGMLGSGGERTDLGAHAFGFLAGLPLGAIAGTWAARAGAPSHGVNRLLGLATAALLVLAWAAAFTLGTPSTG